jgi:hypothetical protein
MPAIPGCTGGVSGVDPNDVTLGIASNPSGVIYAGDLVNLTISFIPKSSLLFVPVSNTILPVNVVPAPNPAPPLWPFTEAQPIPPAYNFFLHIASNFQTTSSFKYRWTHTFKYCNSAGVCSNSPCTTTFDFDINQDPGYLITKKGDVYIKGLVNIQKFSKATPSIYFSSYTFGTFGNSSNYKPNNILLSQNQYILNNYETANTVDISTLMSVMNNNIKLTKGSIINGDKSLSNINILPENILYEFSGNLTIDQSECTQKAIFLVRGNLIFNNNFKSRNVNSGCLFVVEGTTYINNFINNVEAFIITKEFRTLPGTNIYGLLIKGGVIIVNTDANTFGRNINYGRISLDPAEVIEYEGSRYIRLFMDALQEPISLNIKDSQYNK